MTHHRNRNRAALAAASAVTAALLLGACGTDGGDAAGSDKAGSREQHGGGGKAAGNAADVSFAKGMIPHHRQAVAMAGLAASRASSPKVTSLAKDIREAQDPEIRTMSGWLRSWGEKVPAGSPHDMHDMKGMKGMHEGRSMPGMMTAGEGDPHQTRHAPGVSKQGCVSRTRRPCIGCGGKEHLRLRRLSGGSELPAAQALVEVLVNAPGSPTDASDPCRQPHPCHSAHVRGRCGNLPSCDLRTGSSPCTRTGNAFRTSH